MTNTTEVYAAFLKAVGDAGGLRALGRKWNLSPAFLCDVKHGRRGYGPTILKRLGFKAATQRVTTYKRGA